MAESTFDDRFGEWSTFIKAIADQSELGEVLITAAFIEEQLLRVLQSFMVSGRVRKDMVSGPSAVMGTFSAKTSLAFCLGLIDDLEFGSINAIRGIRNEFAHKITTSFSDDRVRGKLDALAWAVGEQIIGNFDGHQVFHLAAQRTIMSLLNRSDHVMIERRLAKNWPPERTDYDYDPNYDPKDYIY